MQESYKIIEQKEFANYPLLSRLLELHDVPKQIYIQGDIPEITIDEYGRANPRILTIVGSRKNTNYGRKVIEMLLSSIQNENVIIISGLAYGIDSIAHTEALKNNLKTIAIPGSGLSRKVLYPKSHYNLSMEIVSKGGLLISELPPETEASQWTFPARNRIMSALSDAVLIIEAEEKSGTLITARQALELGRDIGAIPGDIFSPTSAGTNTLIRDGAYIINEISDLYSLLHLSYKENNLEDKKDDIKNLSNDEKKILELLIEPMQKDDLLTISKMTLTTFMQTFSSLEIKHLVEETFGEVRRIV